MHFVSLSHPGSSLVIEPLDYSNAYDFKTPHRHDYFEIILMKKGGGHQLIDFVEIELKSNSVYIVYPGQIHLLNRAGAEGLIIQFKKDIFNFLHALQPHHLYFAQPVLELETTEFLQLYELADTILSLSNRLPSSFSTLKSYSYLQIVLITLIEYKQELLNKSDKVAGRFLQLVSEKVKETRRVADYAAMMGLSTDKLTAFCKESLGHTPLKIIHEELLLEIKRSMVLDELTLKEIAFALNFESASNFSAFVKTTTGSTPSELYRYLTTNL